VTDVSGGTQWPSNRQRRDYDLTDRYGTDDGTVILTGIQAITRILLEGAGSTGTPAEHPADWLRAIQALPWAGSCRDLASA
jgi:hypothetical protein